MCEQAAGTKSASVADLGPSRVSATRPELTNGTRGAENTQTIAVSPLDELPEDEITQFLSWLEMNDMVGASQVSRRWRQIALSTASL